MRWIALLTLCLLISACNLANDVADTPSPTPAPTLDTQPEAQPLQTSLPPSQPSAQPTAAPTTSDSAINPDATPTFDVTGLSPQIIRNNYPVQANAGQTILVDYSVTLRGVGLVYIYVEGPQQTIVGGINVRQTTDDTLEVLADVAGQYMVYVAFSSLPGSYELSFSVR